MQSPQPHPVVLSTSSSLDNHIEAQNTRLDRMHDTLTRLGAMAGLLEEELGHQSRDIEELEGVARERERDAALLRRRSTAAADAAQRTELFCWILVIASAICAFVWYTLAKGQPIEIPL